MSFELAIHEKDNYLNVICSGEYELDAMLDTCKKTLSIATRKGFSAILMDFRNLPDEPSASAMDRFDFGKSLANMLHGLVPKIQIAIVGNEPHVDPERFGETVAVNRGAAFRVFSDIDKAIKWLNPNGSQQLNLTYPYLQIKGNINHSFKK